MDRLWSPWRARHVASFADGTGVDADGRTLFERLAASGDDEAALILWRGRHVFAVLNRYPYTNGHLMLVPYRAVRDYDALTPDEQAELFAALARAIRWLRVALAPEGFNVGMNLGSAGGAAIAEHLHLHVVPRWAGDTNFMPVVGGAKVIPEALDVTYARLRDAIAAAGDDAATARAPGCGDAPGDATDPSADSGALPS